MNRLEGQEVGRLEAGYDIQHLPRDGLQFVPALCLLSSTTDLALGWPVKQPQTGILRGNHSRRMSSEPRTRCHWRRRALLLTPGSGVTWAKDMRARAKENSGSACGPQVHYLYGSER